MRKFHVGQKVRIVNWDGATSCSSVYVGKIATILRVSMATGGFHGTHPYKVRVGNGLSDVDVKESEIVACGDPDLNVDDKHLEAL